MELREATRINIIIKLKSKLESNDRKQTKRRAKAGTEFGGRS